MLRTHRKYSFKAIGTRQRAFTLVELLTVVAVLAVITLLAAPNLTSFFDSNRVSTTSNNLLASMMQAKGEAVRRGRRVMMVPNSGGWSAGWNIYVDSRASPNCAYDTSGDTLIGKEEATSGVTITSAVPASGSQYISFIGTGESREYSGCSGTDSTSLNGNIVITAGATTRRVCLSGQGRAYVTANTSCA
jgi:type IV fimbrial biogenesis protein FimT